MNIEMNFFKNEFLDYVDSDKKIFKLSGQLECLSTNSVSIRIGCDVFIDCEVTLLIKILK